MKKTIVLVMLLLSVSFAAATPGENPFNCDIDGNGVTDSTDKGYADQIRNWIATRDIRADVTKDGVVDLRDWVTIVQNYKTEGWCHKTFGSYFEPVKENIVQVQQCSCHGMSKTSLGSYLFGDWKYFQNHETAKAGLDAMYVTRTEYDKLMYRLIVLECKQENPTAGLWDRSDCVMQKIADYTGVTQELNGKIYKP
jgi:hypothetical protein